MPQRVIW